MRNAIRLLLLMPVLAFAQDDAPADDPWAEEWDDWSEEEAGGAWTGFAEAAAGQH